MLNWIISFFNKFKLEKNKKLSKADVLKSITFNTEITDEEYWTSDVDDLKDFLDTFLFQHLKWVGESRDCDNFSFALKGYKDVIAGNYALGVVHVKVKSGGAHSLNFFIDSDKTFWYVEPQTSEVFGLDVGREMFGYTPYWGVI